MEEVPGDLMKMLIHVFDSFSRDADFGMRKELEIIYIYYYCHSDMNPLWMTLGKTLAYSNMKIQSERKL